MKNNRKIWMMELFIIGFLGLLLICSQEILLLASNGLLIWYKNMIPALFPFMVLSGFLVRTGMANKLSRILKPLFFPVFPFSDSMIYAIFMGFLCGFPMGAKVVADLWDSGRITYRQATYLLSFCNNIGPLYLIGYVIPLFGWEKLLPVFGIMYGIPLGYGILLSYWKRDELKIGIKQSNSSCPTDYLSSFQQSLDNAIGQITLLGGCMIFFNCLQIYPRLLSDYLPQGIQLFYHKYLYGPFCCLLEIGGGLGRMAENGGGLEALAYLTFGGLSCIVQTSFILKNTGLSLVNYINHKLLQTAVVFLLLLFI